MLDEGKAGDNVGCLLRGVKRDEIERGQCWPSPVRSLRTRSSRRKFTACRKTKAVDTRRSSAATGHSSTSARPTSPERPIWSAPKCACLATTSRCKSNCTSRSPWTMACVSRFAKVAERLVRVSYENIVSNKMRATESSAAVRLAPSRCWQSIRLRKASTQGCSSIGRAAVSKTAVGLG